MGFTDTEDVANANQIYQQRGGGEPVDQVASALMGTLNAELPENAALVAVPVSRAQALVIASPEDRSVCSALLGDCKQRVAAIEEDRKRLTRPLDALKKMIMDKYRPAVEFFTSEGAIYAGKLTVWDREQDRLREVEAARVRAEAENQRQMEMAAAREAERVEREKAAELRRQADAANDAVQAEQMRQEAQEREELARQESAIRQEQAAMISTPVVGPAVAHIGGESQSWKYSAEEGDFDLMVKAVYEKRLPRSVLIFNPVGANRLANALQDEFRAQYPEATCGVRLKKEPVYTHRRKK